MIRVSCCLSSYMPYENETTRQYFLAAIKSASPFEEVVAYVEGPFSREDLKDCQNVRLLPVAKHLSASDGFNFAVSEAKMPWVSLLCDDDYYNSEHVQILKESTNNMAGDILYSPYYILKDGKTFYHSAPNPTFTLQQILWANFISNSAFIKKRCWDELGGRIDGTVCDWMMWIKAKRQGKRFGYVPLPLYYQRFYATSLYERQRKEWGDEKIQQQLVEAAYA